MSKPAFNDEELRQAVLKAHDVWLDSLPSPEECEQDISKDTQIKIEKLMKKTERRRIISIFAKRAAAVFAVILAGITGWLTVDTEVRSSGFDFIRNEYNGIVMYSYDGTPEQEDFPEYELTWIPEGLELEDKIITDVTRSFLYTNPETDEGFIFSYDYLGNNGQLQLLNVREEDKYEKFKLNGRTVEYYISADENDSDNLIWTDDRTALIFGINTNMDRETVLKIYKGVRQVKPEK